MYWKPLGQHGSLGHTKPLPPLEFDFKYVYAPYTRSPQQSKGAISDQNGRRGSENVPLLDYPKSRCMNKVWDGEIKWKKIMVEISVP